MKNLLKALLFSLSTLLFCSCNQEEQAQPSTANNNNGQASNISFLSFQMDGESINLNSANGITSIDLIVALDLENPSNAGTGMSFRNSNWPFTDRVFFEVVLPIDSSGVSTFNYSEPFIINGSKISPWMYEYLYLGTLLVKWESADGNLDGLREHNESDNLTFYNSITNIAYAGNHHYDTFENLWKCDYQITGNFEMRLQNENSGEIKVLSNGEYSMVVDVLAE